VVGTRRRYYLQMEFSGHGRVLAVRVPGFYTRLWDLTIASAMTPIIESERLRQCYSEFTVMSFNAEDTQLAVGAQGRDYGSIPNAGPPRVYDMASGTELLQLDLSEENANIRLLGFLADGRLAMSCWDKAASSPSFIPPLKVIFWDVDNRRMTQTMSFDMVHEGTHRGYAALSPGGKYLLTNTVRGKSQLHIFDMQTGARIVQRMTALWCTFIFSSDGEVVAFESRNGDILRTSETDDNPSSYGWKHNFGVFNFVHGSLTTMRVMAHS
jgi:WD40 repeat protein